MGRCFLVAVSYVYRYFGVYFFGFGIRDPFTWYPFHAFTSDGFMRSDASFNVTRSLNKGKEPEKTNACMWNPLMSVFTNPPLFRASASLRNFNFHNWLFSSLWVGSGYFIVDKQTQQSINRKNKQKLSPISIFNEFLACGVCCDQTQIIRKVKHEQSLRRTKC